jgi:protein phosphatase
VLDDVLDLEDVTGKRIVETRLHRTITIREENSIAALEVTSGLSSPRLSLKLPSLEEGGEPVLRIQ